MSLSLSVLFTLLFLAPGFAGYFGLNLAARGKSVRHAAPLPNSLVFLVGVSLCALAAHCVALFVFAAQSLYCRGHRCLAVGFDPDAYAGLVRMARSPVADFRSPSVLYELVMLVILCAATCFAARAGAALELRRGDRSYVGAALYGWLAPYVADARGGSFAATAYVLTKLHGDNFAIGYRGVVNGINLTAGNEIGSITLVAVERFGLSLATLEGVGERTVSAGELLDLVHIPGREVENVVLALVSLDEAERVEPYRSLP